MAVFEVHKTAQDREARNRKAKISVTGLSTIKPAMISDHEDLPSCLSKPNPFALSSDFRQKSGA